MQLSTNQVAAIAIGAVALALTYNVCHLKLQMPQRVSAVISFAFGLITFLYLTQNPTVLADTVTRIALALIGSVIMMALLVRRLS